ncbi:MAG TPA: TnsA endonuclease N-terminal domain-containing protein [Patescibacteria group bacterium]|nr:TnsA endonuclease N-terminal domain-containing protein [Patescibacteria group bacterium]
MSRKIKSYEQMLKEGYGQKRGEEYKPWGTFRFASKGQTGRPSRGLHFNREYLFFSRIEQRAFHLFDFQDDILEIREQFPILPREQSFLIANELDIWHPQNKETGEIYVRTIDMIVDYNNGNTVAYQVKKKEDINARTEEKFQIERAYFKRFGVEHLIITEEQVDEIKADNIEDLKQNWNLHEYQIFSTMEEEEMLHFIAELYMRVIDNKSKLCDITNQFDLDLNFPCGTGLTIFRHLVIRKVLEIDLSTSLFSADKVVKILSAKDLK